MGICFSLLFFCRNSRTFLLNTNGYTTAGSVVWMNLWNLRWKQIVSDVLFPMSSGCLHTEKRNVATGTTHPNDNSNNSWNQNQKHIYCQVVLTLTRNLLWCGCCFRGQQKKNGAATVYCNMYNWNELQINIYKQQIPVFFLSFLTSASSCSHAAPSHDTTSPDFALRHLLLFIPTKSLRWNTKWLTFLNLLQNVQTIMQCIAQLFFVFFVNQWPLTVWTQVPFGSSCVHVTIFFDEALVSIENDQTVHILTWLRFCTIGCGSLHAAENTMTVLFNMKFFLTFASQPVWRFSV